MAKIPTRLKWTTSTRKDGSKRYQWTKIYKGKRKTWSLKAGESKADGAKRIKAECQKWMAEIDAIENGLLASVAEKKKQVEELEKQRDEVEEQDTKTHYLEVRQRLESAGISGEEAARQAIDAVMLRYLVGDSPDDMSFAGEPYWLKGLGFDASKHPETWEDARSELFPDSRENTFTIQKSINDFINHSFSMSHAKQNTLNRAEKLRRNLEVFSNWYKHEIGSTNQSINKINASILTRYHAYLIGLNKAPTTLKDWFQSFKQFVRWAYENEYLDREPRNLRSKSLTIHIPATKIKTISVDDFQTIVKYANQRTRLYILLMANTGMTSADLSKLKKTEIDLTKGTITRKRSKTEKVKNAPEITWFLWPETIQLLKAEIDKSKNELALLNKNGNILCEEKINSEGKYFRNDTIRLALGRVCTKAKKHTGKDIKITQRLLRATAASLIRTDKILGRYADYFLAHVPQGVGERHYFSEHDDVLKDVCAYLRSAWGFPLS